MRGKPRRPLDRPSIKRFRYRLALERGLVLRAPREIDELLRMPEREPRHVDARRFGVSAIGADRGVAMPELIGHLPEFDGSRPPALRGEPARPRLA